jgi:GNAT superfamily N-acetyltransferase
VLLIFFSETLLNQLIFLSSMPLESLARIGFLEWQIFEEELMMLEQLFNPNLRFTKFRKRDACYADSTLISYVYLSDYNVVGEAYGMSARQAHKRGYFGYSDYGKVADDKAFYFMSLAVLPEFRGRGIGARLFDSVLHQARNVGYSYFAGHFLAGPSLSLAESHPFSRIREYNNFFHSGLKCVLGEIDLTCLPEDEKWLSDSEDYLPVEA